MKDIVYPERYEIKEVCENFIKRRTLNTFMQERGIFAINASTDDVSRILWQLRIYEETLINVPIKILCQVLL